MAEGDLSVQFEVRTPDEAAARTNTGANELRGLPEAAALKTVIIVANGPSARDSALWERLRASSGLTTVALNGALKNFLARGFFPTYWACCDPQELTTAFVPDDPPRDVIYLLASKCHPALFDRLKDRDVRIWRLDDFSREKGALHVPCAVSITLVTQGLFRFLGFHRFEMYGWDCCYLDGEHHATGQPHTDEFDQTVELRNETGELMRAFRTTGSWMAELQDASIQAANFAAMGYEMVVHGDGAVGAILRGRGLI